MYVCDCHYYFCLSTFWHLHPYFTLHFYAFFLTLVSFIVGIYSFCSALHRYVLLNYYTLDLHESLDLDIIYALLLR